MHVSIPDLVVWYLVFVFSTTCHEAAHAWVAFRGGDHTAYAGGHVSLDPWPHMRRSPFGMIVVPVVSFVLGGWMIGWASVPLNPEWARHYPRRAALMALAGPIANLTLTLAAFLTIRALLSAGVLVMPASIDRFSELVTLPSGASVHSPLAALASALSVTLVLNVILGLFNLIPLPPLDGAAVIEGASPQLGGSLYARLREIPAFELLGMAAAWKISSYFVYPLLFRVLYYL